MARSGDVFGVKKLSCNVPAVTDVFLRPKKKNAKHFYGRKKMWWSKTPQRGEAPTGVLRSLAAVRRRTVTDLLRLQKKYFLCYSIVFENIILFICYFFISFIVILFLFSILYSI
jgi:hypothetical protein